MADSNKYKSAKKPTWCPGCGDYAIWSSIRNALNECGIPPHKVMTVYGIGCSGNMANTIRTYGVHSIHGRTLPVATGVRLANSELTVLAVGGDGDGFGIGVGHFIHTARRNLNITYIVCDNQIYGLTTGQYSPTSEKGFVSKTSPQGSIDSPVNPISLALSAGATFVARGFSGDPVHLSQLIAKGIAHKGFSFIDVFQPCVTFNHVNTYEFFRKRIYTLEKEGYMPTSLEKAFEKAHEWEKRIPTGIFFKVELPTYEDEVKTIQEKPLVKQQPSRGHVDISSAIPAYQ